ncbi:MAG: alpha/beta hydrolase [Pseudomonadota bacterium]
MTDPFLPDAISDETARFNADLTRRLDGLPTPMELDIAKTRAARAEGKGLLPISGPHERGRWVEVPSGGALNPVSVRVIDPTGPACGTYLHIHGGGWTFGEPSQSDGPNLALAEATGARVVSVRYRLGPEHRWPAPLEDGLAAALWALETGPGPLVIGGESAGAHLAAMVLIGLRERGAIGDVVGAALTYGMYDLRLTPSAANWGAHYLVLSTPVIRWFVGNLTGGADPTAASPLLANLKGLVPAWFTVGTRDPLIDDTLFMAARWRAAGLPTEVHIAPGGIHGFDLFDLHIAQAAVEAKHRFVARCLG